MFRTKPYIIPKRTPIVVQVTRKTFLWSIKAPCRSVNFDQQISLDADGVESYLSQLKRETLLEFSHPMRLQTTPPRQILLQI